MQYHTSGVRRPPDFCQIPSIKRLLLGRLLPIRFQARKFEKLSLGRTDEPSAAVNKAVIRGTNHSIDSCLACGWCNIVVLIDLVSA